MTNKEAIKYLISPIATSTEPSAEYLKQKEAYELAIKALERPQGEWITVDGYDGDEHYECSNCGEPWVLYAGTPEENNMNFCPNCGADMKGGASKNKLRK